MILVDTEVVSEPLRGAPESCDRRVARRAGAGNAVSVRHHRRRAALRGAFAAEWPASGPTARGFGGPGVADVCRTGAGLRSCGLASLCGADGEGAVRGANDNGGPEARIDTVVMTLARLLGRKIAREEFRRLEAANDNPPAKDAGGGQES